MKIVLINKSDARGGAAVVTRRLMEALRGEGVDARMLVAEKLTDSPYVTLAARKRVIRDTFLKERLKIFMANGMNRATLFKIDTGGEGLPLWRHPLVEDADAILLNWVNQGMLSLNGVEKLLATGKPVVWTMHDMWNMTGLCHHAGSCIGYLGECGDCPLLGKKGKAYDLSYQVWQRKYRLGSMPRKIRYVAVSNWLMKKACESSLLSESDIRVVPNAFPLIGGEGVVSRRPGEKLTILFGAARLDDPIKNMPALVEMTKALRRYYPATAEGVRLITFGNIKDPHAMEGMAIDHIHLGPVKGERALRELYETGEMVVSSSSYETLPGTLVEAQAYGCIPVSFDRGGQRDIIEHGVTGYLAQYSDDPVEGGRRLAEGIHEMAAISRDEGAMATMRQRMRENVERRFSSEAVAKAYISLIE